jgi:hypothetical protein
VRCSVLSAQRDEPMLGTAFTEPGVLLVEQPGPWGHAGLSASRFDPAVAEALAARARAAGLRVLAIRRPAGGFDGPRRRWAVWRPPARGGVGSAAGGGAPANGEVGSAAGDGVGAGGGTSASAHRALLANGPAEPDRSERVSGSGSGGEGARTARSPFGPVDRAGLVWSDFGDDSELLDVPLDGPALGSTVGEFDPEPLYLVCAHSKRDVCCAVRGRPLAAALEARRPGRVWECSHTGGHRFAPIVLALPVGALYGRVPAGDAGADSLIAATERAEIIPELLRGLIGFAPVEQAAIGQLMIAQGLTDPRAITVRSSVETEPGQWDARLDVAGPAERPGSRWLVQLAVESVEISYASCAKPAAKAERQIRLVDVSACHEQ